MKCHRHHQVSATVSCGRCDRAICSDCMVPAPAGMRCRECVAQPTSVTGAVDTTDRIGIAISVALAVAIAGAMLVKSLGVFAMVAGPCYGAAVSQIVLSILGTSQKPAYLYSLSLGSIFIGSVIAFSHMLPNIGIQLMTLPASVADPIVGLSIGLALSAGYGRMRQAIG